MASWSKIARRIRIPLGFVLAALYLWLAQPEWWSVAAGAGIAAVGLGVRAVAAGHIRKDVELTTTGPYAYTRNPLYLGSIIMGAGMALAARNLWIVAAMALLFVAIYVPVIRDEERRLRAMFPAYDEYARHVPRFGIIIPPPAADRGHFSAALYFERREYNALLGTLLMVAALAAKKLLSQ